ncbi:MAG: NAD(P)-binding protein [Myxococcota bacterium]
MKRRTLLKGLAAATAASGCDRGGTTPPTLSFVGQSPERGHMLRGPKHGEAVAERLRVNTLIVGAGAAGTAAAWRLHRAGLEDYLVVELEDAPGGTAQSGHTARTAYPMGAHYLPSPHPELRWLHELLREFGVELGTDAAGRPEYDPTVVCRAPVERHRYKGQWFSGVYPGLGETDEEAEQWQRWLDHLRDLDAQRGPDGRRLFALPVDHSSTHVRELDGQSMAAYLDARGLDSWRLRWTLDYACRDDYGTPLEQTSAFAALHHFLCRGLEEVHDRVTLMWPGGNGELVQMLAQAGEVAPRRRTGLVVFDIDTATGTTRAWDVSTQSVVEIQAKTVLWAAPRFILPHVIAGDPLARGALSYAPWLVANVEVDRRPGGIGVPLAWDNVNIEANHLGYVVATHGESLPDVKTQTGTVLSFYDARVPAPDQTLDAVRNDLLTASLDDLAVEVTGALEGMHPGITPSIRSMAFARWGHAMVRPVPGLLFGDALARAATPIGVVHPCATDVGGVPLFEQAFSNGVRAAERALLAAGQPVDTLIQPS